jgi:Ribbon-helix-helix protein, copG family
MSGKNYKLKSGHTVTDSDIERMADEAERGYSPDQLRRRRGRPLIGTAPATVRQVRLDPDLATAVEARAEAEHTSVSEVIRTALRKFLDVA